MSEWSLKEIFTNLNDDINKSLEISRRSLAHPSTKGDASENVWLDLLKKYLPKRYKAAKAHVVDSRGTFSEQMMWSCTMGSIRPQSSYTKARP